MTKYPPNLTHYPLTHAEKRIYLTQKFHPQSSMWNWPTSFRLPQGNTDLLVQAIRFVVNTNKGLRIRFTEIEGEPRKLYQEQEEPSIDQLDFADKNDHDYFEWAEQRSHQPIPMLESPLYRFAVVKGPAGSVYLHTLYHHIALDGGASAVAAQRILDAYQELLAGREPTSPPHMDAEDPLLAVESEQSYLGSEAFESDKQYWNSRFEKIPEPLDLAGRSRDTSHTASLQIARHLHRFSPKTGKQLADFCAREKISPFRVLLASFGLYFSRILRRSELVLGSATRNRHPDSMQDALGMFVSTVPLYLDLQPDHTFTDLLSQARKVVKDASAHERYPYNLLVSDLRERTGEAPNLISTSLVEVVRPKLPAGAELIMHGYGESEMALTMYFVYPRRDEPADAPLEIMMMYNIEIFEPWQIEQLAHHVEEVMVQGMSTPEVLLKDMTILPDQDYHRIVEEFNAQESAWESATTVHACIEKQIQRRPGAIAVVYRDKKLTFAELGRQSDILAHHLRSLGAGRNSVVGLLADRCVEIVIAQLAILKSGAAFMPLDAGYPESRIAFMLDDVQAPVVITQTHFLESHNFGNATVVNLDEIAQFPQVADPIDNINTPDDLSVVIYTSGSTGQPKGALLCHHGLCNVTIETMRTHSVTAEDKISKHASFSFDASLLEVFLSLVAGAELHLIPDEIRLSLSHLNEYYETNGITIAFLTTQLGEQFNEFMDNKSLRALLTGGEKLRTFTPRNYQLWNVYGPTECSIYVTQYHVREFEENIPIGTPVAGCRIYILDRYDHPQPIGAAGELCIAGPCVAHGYHNRPEKTSACFVPDPFVPGQTMYRTGDLACWTTTGNILHLGRIDRQVKLRGFRIELGEIENALLNIEHVTQAAVADFQDPRGRVYLCGYYVADGSVQPEQVRSHLESALPDYMVPAHLMRLETMPINPSGKIDRLKLPRPEEQTETQEEFVEPTTELEKQLAQIWSELLGIPKISAEQDFFRAGGDSLKAVALQVLISRQLNHEVDLAEVFAHSTPKSMADYLADRKTDDPASARAAVTPAPKADWYPTTIAQQQLFLLAKMQGIGTTYNMPMRINIEGPVNHKALSEALQTLVRRHEALRTGFKLQDGHCVQIVHDQIYLKMDFAEIQSDDISHQIAGFVRPFAPAQPPLFRSKLLALNSSTQPTRHVLLLDFHHLVFDGVSMGILLRELFDLYAKKDLPEPCLQLKDFTVWQTANEHAAKQAHEDFWLALFESPPESELPTDRPRTPHADFNGAIYNHVFSKELTQGLDHLARNNKATLHHVLLSALATLTARWSDAEDVAIGTSTSGRDYAGAESVVGMFVRTLPTRHKPTSNKSFATLIEETREQMLRVYEHSEYPISSLYEKLGMNRGPGRHPVFDINFVLQNTGMEEAFSIGDLTAKMQLIPTGTAKFDLSFGARVRDGRLHLEVDYRTGLYERETIAHMVGHLESIIISAVENSAIPLGELDILTPEERHTLLDRFNPQPTPLPSWHTVCHAIAEHAKTRPDACAIVAADAQWTYSQLEEAALRGAAAIQAARCQPDEIVVVAADRSVWAIAAMIAVLKSGAAYVAIDPAYPDDRKAFILEDTGARVLVGSRNSLDTFKFDGTRIALDNILQLPDSQQTTTVPLPCGGSDLGYIIFTSGSTGKPKGVCIEHHSMVNFIHWYATHHKINEDSHCAAFAAFSFDVSVVQIFAPLVSGGTLHIIAEDLRRSPLDLDSYFRDHHVSHAHFPTQFAEQFMRMAEASSLRTLVVGGDRLSHYKLGPYRLTNEYGPSEATMACLSYDVPEMMDNPPIGSPVANYRVYILDTLGRLCPIGMPGEICVAGEGVARGYHNRPELTAERFVSDPFYPGERMYRTGDRGRWLATGVVEFLERLDFQVKIRGYRIEPAEIAQRISEVHGILESIVIPIEEPTGNKILVAYVTAATTIQPDEVKSYLREVLPEYMLPAHIVQLEKMPLNPNGKIDRAKLPRPELTTGTGGGPLEPRNAKEAHIAACWESVLGHKGFGLFDSFFEVGGDSLSAISLLATLSETYDVTATDIFAHTTIADQAAKFAEVAVGRSTRLLRLKELTKPQPTNELFEKQQLAYQLARQSDLQLDTDKTVLPKHVLLTGSTGTLGVYLLRELLEKTQAHVTAIVRAESHQAAERRLAEYIEDRFGDDFEVAPQRLTVLAGDLGQADFGLDQTTFERLATEVDTILHSAALTSHYGAWEDFEAANIFSVKNLLSFAQQHQKKNMHHVSTTSVGMGAITDRERILFTEFDLDLGQSTDNLYVCSKLESEKIIATARTEGLPVSVYRAGNITCDSVTGTFQRNVDDNAFFQQIRAYVNLSAAPEALDARNMTYVDQAAQAIVLLMSRPGLLGQTFHIQNPDLLSLSKALSSPELGVRLSRKPFSDFVEFLAHHSSHVGFSEYIERLLLHLGWQDWLTQPSRSTSTTIEVTRSVEILQRLGFVWKKPVPQDLRLLVCHALEDRLAALSKIPDWSRLPQATLLSLVAKLTPQHFGQEQLLQQEAQPIESVHLLIDGMVETYRHNRNGWIGTVRVDSPGTCLGEEAVATREPVPSRSTSEAIGDVFTYSINVQDLRELIHENPDLALPLLSFAAHKADLAERLFVAV